MASMEGDGHDYYFLFIFILSELKMNDDWWILSEVDGRYWFEIELTSNMWSIMCIEYEIDVYKQGLIWNVIFKMWNSLIMECLLY